MIKVSVIVPVYNVDPYLVECLDNIINQTLKEIEIICVDDCSTDNSYMILEEYSKKDSRIKLIKHKENRGLGPARNTGIENATGEYISFIDSDDYVSLDFLENLYSTAKKFTSDVVSTLSIYRGNNEKLFNYYDISDNISEVSIINEKIDTYEYLFMTAWNKLYNRFFLLQNDLYFMEIKSGPEDEDFYQRLLVTEPKTSYNHKSIYYYRKRDNSIIQVLDIDEYVLFNNSINAIKLMENSINYTKKKNNDLLDYVSKRAFLIILDRFHRLKNDYFKTKYYFYFHNFVHSIYLSNYLFNDLQYSSYLRIRKYNSYYLYVIEELNISLAEYNNKVRDLNIRLNLLEFRYFNLLNKIAWFIPIKKWRDKFRESILTEQNRTEQNRTEQNRTEQNRTEQNRIHDILNLYKFQVILFY